MGWCIWSGKWKLAVKNSVKTVQNSSLIIELNFPRTQLRCRNFALQSSDVQKQCFFLFASFSLFFKQNFSNEIGAMSQSDVACHSLVARYVISPVKLHDRDVAFVVSVVGVCFTIATQKYAISTENCKNGLTNPFKTGMATRPCRWFAPHPHSLPRAANPHLRSATAAVRRRDDASSDFCRLRVLPSAPPWPSRGLLLRRPI